ncbi:riboflavin synthase [bacterium]|nr:riboflavin synthase [bacterium]
MFTGIVEELGKIQSIDKKSITVACECVLDGIKLGDSVAVNGICLTVVDIIPRGFVADVSEETFRITALGQLKAGDLVNLERALRADGRFGGHIVSGHVDGLAKVVEIKKKSGFYDFVLELNPEQTKYVVKKGSITVNGISLTIANKDKNFVSMAIIPHTFEYTNLKTLKINDYVNIEVDIIAKYVENFLSTSDNESRISLKFLQEHGF